MEDSNHLAKTLGPLKLWGLGVGYVIAGMFFGWSHGLIHGGVAGLFAATILMIIMYFCFVFSYCELCSLDPDAGGIFVYAYKAFGRHVGFTAGLLQNIEFIFAAPAISLAITAYIESFFSFHHPFLIASSLYFIFTLINIFGINLSAKIEVLFTIIAVASLLSFFYISTPHFNSHFLIDETKSLNIFNVFAAIPFAIWFFLGIEGLANVSEEAINPQKNMTFAFISAMTSLAILALLTFMLTVGIGGWQKVVYASIPGMSTETPLQLSLVQIISQHSLAYKWVVIGSLFGLIASFNGLILVGGRAVYRFCREGYFYPSAGKISQKYKTPIIALCINSLIGIIAVYSGKTDTLIIISALAALCCYVLCTLTMIKFRQKRPDMKRPFVVPCYPYIPLIALLLSVLAIIAMVWAYPLISGVFFLSILLLVVYEFKIGPNSYSHQPIEKVANQ